MSDTENTRTSRPLRALFVLLVAYAGARIALLWQPAGVLPETALPTRAVAYQPLTVARPSADVKWVPSPSGPPASVAIALDTVVPPRAHARSVETAVFVNPSVVPSWLQTAVVIERAAQTPASSSTLVAKSLPIAAQLILPPASKIELWSGSFYAVTRGAGSVGTAPLLGGTQAGFRAYRMVGRALAATASFAASPGAGGTREATIGVALRASNLGLIAERSLKIGSGGATGFRLFGYAGVTQALPADFRLDGYGQAGVSSGEAFADGALAVERSLLAQGNVEVSGGASGWASIQRGARRLDVGPQLVARIPVAGQRIRVSAEWRVRVAGNANPGSGPSVTVGADF